MQTVGSAASVVAAIREEAAAEVDRIDEALTREIEGVRTEVASARVAIPDRAARLAAARAESEENIARQEWEGRRQAIEQREAWIDRVSAAARKKWRLDAAQTLSLVREALQIISAAEVEIAVAERDRAQIDPLKLGRTIRIAAADIAGGCIVTGGDLVFDNSLEARARRLEPVWRNALSEVYKPDVTPSASETPERKEGR